MRAAIVVLLVAVAPARAQEKPEELIRNGVTAVGGAETLRKFPAGLSTAKGTIYDGGAEVAVVVEQSFHTPGQCRTVMRSEVAGQKVELAMVMNGPKVRQTLNGTAVPFTEVTLKECHTGVLLLEVGHLLPLLTEEKFMLKPDKAGVLVQVRGYPDLRLGFDRKSGHLVRITRKYADPGAGKDVDLEYVFSDFKAFDGLVKPTRTVALKDGRKSVELVTESFTPLEKIDPKEFAIED
jgi:hypothetical protein